jgi:hypothetical protein
LFFLCVFRKKTVSLQLNQSIVDGDADDDSGGWDTDEYKRTILRQNCEEIVLLMAQVW